MAIQNFFTSRDNNLDGNTYVGQLGRLWYNPDTNSVYASDGVTVGGIPVDLATGANAVFTNISVNTISSDDSTQVVFAEDIRVDGDIEVTGNISPATTTKIGGVRAGPGANISNTGLLTIDTANLAFSFGNFTANNNILEIVNSDEDMILATSGNAEIQLVGNIGFYKPNGLPPNTANRYFQASNDGQISILVPNTDPLLGAVQIIGSDTGNSISPAVAGVMLHITGQPDTNASQYIDGVGENANYIGRRFNGNVTAPTQVLTGNDIVRFSGQGYTSSGFSNAASGTIGLFALEDFTAANQGTIWRIYNNALNGNTRQEVANVSVANGVVATQFETAGNVSATGNVDSGNVNTASVRASGAILSSGTAGVGYTTGAGGTVTQLTSKTTAVTLNKISGEITSNNASIPGDSVASFRLNNSTISNTDVMIINQTSVANIGLYAFMANCQNGYANIHIHNATNSVKSDVIVMRYAVIKGAVV